LEGISYDTCKGACSNYNKLAAQGSFTYTRIDTDWQAQRHIRHYGAVVARFDLYEDFEPWFEKHSGTGVYQQPNGSVKIQAFHAVLLVGYDNEKQYWIAANSWGTDWPGKGFFKVRHPKDAQRFTS
jgi:C1A family cysteine protease